MRSLWSAQALTGQVGLLLSSHVSGSLTVQMHSTFPAPSPVQVSSLACERTRRADRRQRKAQTRDMRCAEGGRDRGVRRCKHQTSVRAFFFFFFFLMRALNLFICGYTLLLR